MKERLLNAKKENEMSWLLFCCALVIVVLIIAIVNNKILMRVQVFGPSMNNTLYGGEMSADGDYVGGDILLAVRNFRPERGEIVVISGKKPGALIIKRVIGVGGDQIKITESGEVYRNGVLLDESSYAIGKTEGSTVTGEWSETERAYLYSVPEGQYFYLGDNRENSMDSRSAYGYCSGNQIVGVVPGWSVSVKGIVTFFTEAFLPVANFVQGLFS